MNFKSLPRLAAISALLFSGVFAGSASAEAINGAIFTSNFDGSIVNANHYPAKTDVYLNGGPSNAGCKGGDLDDGDYYFQVTDPSGATLLSSDSIWNRAFRVTDGKVSGTLGVAPHPSVGPNAPCGSVAIKLWPFNDTPNGGGVYKVWITRIADFTAACNNDPAYDCGKAGFVPGNTKTDTFKAGTGDQEQQELLGAVRAFKFYDHNANGRFDNNRDAVQDPGEDWLLDGWMMTLQSLEQAVDSTALTSNGSVIWDGLTPGIDYTVEEGMPLQTNWVHSATIYVGHDGTPVNPAGPLTVEPDETTSVLFGNYCTIPSNGRTLGFWSNKNGQSLIGNDDIAVLIALNLRNADGSHFDPATKTGYRTWLLNGNAVNMAYMLSVQLSAMRLNVLNFFVNGEGYYVPAGMTVNQLIATADAALASDGETFADDPANRADQERLKNWLDELNNGAGLLSPTACAYTFP